MTLNYNGLPYQRWQIGILIATIIYTVDYGLCFIISSCHSQRILIGLQRPLRVLLSTSFHAKRVTITLWECELNSTVLYYNLIKWIFSNNNNIFFKVGFLWQWKEADLGATWCGWCCVVAMAGTQCCYSKPRVEGWNGQCKFVAFGISLPKVYRGKYTTRSLVEPPPAC